MTVFPPLPLPSPPHCPTLQPACNLSTTSPRGGRAPHPTVGSSRLPPSSRCAAVVIRRPRCLPSSSVVRLHRLSCSREPSRLSAQPPSLPEQGGPSDPLNEQVTLLRLYVLDHSKASLILEAVSGPASWGSDTSRDSWAPRCRRLVTASAFDKTTGESQ